MENQANHIIEPDVPPQTDAVYENCADATGLCFAAAILVAFLTAGAIVYRSADPDFRTASNQAVGSMAQAAPLNSAVVPQR